MSKIYDFETGERTRTGDEFLEDHQGQFEKVMLIGFDHDGDVCFGANGVSVRDAIFLLEHIKHELIENWDG